jgi:hypothetical protein
LIYALKKILDKDKLLYNKHVFDHLNFIYILFEF